jgi:hypothetical protein
MQLIGLTSLDEVVGKRVGVVLKSSTSQVETITAEVFMREKKPFIDCIPLRRRTNVVALPDEAIVARAQEANPPWPFAIIISGECEAGLFIAALIRAGQISRN